MTRTKNKRLRAAAKRRRKDREQVRRKIQNLQHKRGCPTPNKAAYPTEEAADKALRRSWRRTCRGKMPTRVYQCECGSFHLTSRSDS